MPIQEGDVLYDRVENELSSLLDPGSDLGVDGNPDIHAQVMAGLNVKGDDDNVDDADDNVDADNADVDADNVDDDDKDDKTDKDGKKGTKKNAKGVKDEKTDIKPLYQDDPEYKAALEVKATLDQVLKDYGLEDLQDLMDELKAGTDIHEIIGDLDLKELIKSHKTLQYYNEEWAKQEAAKQKENETPEETIKRLEREKQELINKEGQSKEEAKRIEEHKKLVKEFDDTIDLILEAQPDIDDDSKSLVRQLMGINNDNLNITVTDKKAATKATQKLITMLKERDARIAQKAVDAYAAGKSEIVIKDKAKTSTASHTAKRFNVPKNATPNDYLASANSQLLEILTKAADNEL